MDKTFTYEGLIASSDLDWIRLTIGDTDSTQPLLYDVEINAILSLFPSKNKAAQLCIESILIKLASSSTDYKIGPESVSASQRYEQYKSFYENFKKNLTAGSIAPQAPETSTPIFSVGMLDTGSGW